MKTCAFIRIAAILGLGLAPFATQAQDAAILEKTSAYDVIWDTPSANSLGSMPLGNGDIGLNVWVEPDGGLCIYLSKTDSWSENGQLLKLGKIRISLSPNPFAKGKPFLQRLNLVDGEIRIRAGKPSEQVDLVLWVDANHPVAEIEVRSARPVAIRAELLPWRTARRSITDNTELASVYGLRPTPEQPVYQEPDEILPAGDNRITWYHRNLRSVWLDNLKLQALEKFAESAEDPLFYRTFGASVKGDGMISESATVLRTSQKTSNCRISVFPLTARTLTGQEWLSQLEYGIRKIEGISAESRQISHRQWWNSFWQRSYIFLSSDHPVRAGEAQTVTRGYILQRFINACGGRGAYPIKFNGSIFTTDTYDRKSRGGYDADFRLWGGPYWFQNTRLPYWSMLMAGDLDCMPPFFNMYFNSLPIRRFATKKYYGHDGAYFPETINFWGTYVNENYGLKRDKMPDGLTENTYIRYYWTGALELGVMMLDYYDFTGSASFARDTLVPFLSEILTFYGKHWMRDIDGKILFTPAQSLETYHTSVNPAPEIAGLTYVAGRMLKLGSGLVSDERRKEWIGLVEALPALPTRTAGGETILAPAAYAAQEANIENPELYAIFPYRIYGVGKPGAEIAISTFAKRKFRYNIGWQHSSIQAACLGLADEAAALVLDKFSHSDPECRFPAFWGPNYDWSPDQDHGTVGMTALQRMLVQYDDGRLMPFPAWPEGWNAEFRLRVPGGKLAEGSIIGGKREFREREAQVR